jgi:aminoglycoside 3-N-acetyltransferase
MKDAEIENILCSDWNSAGLKAGDTVLIHSSLKRTLDRVKQLGGNATPDLVLRSLRAAVGSSGTLIFPLFNFDFTKGVAFDIRNTPSKMGALTECARMAPDAVRTGHPIYSFAVLGSNSSRFRGIENFSGYGADSPFAILRELDGKIAVLDLTDQNSMTFYHHVEEMHEVNYRFHKIFQGDYVNSAGISSNRKFGLFVRDLEKCIETDVDRMGDFLWKKNLYSGFQPGKGSGLRVISARTLYNEVSKIIKDGRAVEFLYSVGSTS